MIKRVIADRRATAAAEMALIFPIFGFVSLNVMDLSMFMYSRMQTEQAAQAAVSVARFVCNSATKLPATSPSGHCSATLQSQMQAAAQATSLGTQVTISAPTEGFYCANGTDNLQLVAAANASPPATCTAVVTGSTSKPGDYISVTASFTYVPFAPGITITSALPSPIQQTAWMRLQ